MEGIESESFSGYKHIFSGHIHWREKYGNYQYIGCPYQLRSPDTDNEKGFYLIDIDNETDTFIPNVRSPKFISISYKDMMAMEVAELSNLFNNNYVTILVGNEFQQNFNSTLVKDKFPMAREMSFKDMLDNSKIDAWDYQEIDPEIERRSKLDVLEYIQDYIDRNQANLGFDDDIAATAKSSISKIYEKVNRDSVII
jgi:hypothetical protein